MMMLITDDGLCTHSSDATRVNSAFVRRMLNVLASQVEQGLCCLIDDDAGAVMDLVHSV
jgi:hypothetical protein